MSDQLDFILAKEAELLYKRAKEFDPVDGNLKVWRGSIPGRGEFKDASFELEIRIPKKFPKQAPEVKMITPTIHPKVDEDSGKVNLRILTYWRPDYHVYQIINSIKGLFARIPPKVASLLNKNLQQQKKSKPEPETLSNGAKKLESKFQRLESEINSLRTTVNKRDEEVARLRSQLNVHNVPEEGKSNLESILMPSDPIKKQIIDLESEKIAVEDLIQTLEEKFDMAEIGSGEYSRLYKKYNKTLYLINKKLDELKS
ncbi:MAG: hypothetical protein EU549_00165 [Promethearchaeota archaeon]|nr:MAG: hypothetical protein EU549_00165 [Candidatus Lokiarchaeota archaeon]